MLLTLFSSGGGGGGGGAVAHYANAGGSAVTSVDTSASPFTSTTGSTFVICVSYNSNPGAPTSVTDNKGNTYVLKLNQTTAVNGRIYVCENGTGGAGHYATVSLPFTDYPSLHFMELTGVPAGSFDQVVGAADFSSPYTATTGTLAQANELILSYISADGTGGTDTYAETSGFTLLGQVNDSSQYWPSAVAYKVVSATTAVPTSWTVAPSVGNTAVIVAGFKVSAGAGVTGTAAWTEANDTTAIAAASTVSGSAAWTESDDTAALSGTVGSSVTGSIAWTEANDTAALTGAATVSGTAAWTETNDGASASGSVTASGTASWTEANDVAALSGNVGTLSVSGTVAWVEDNDAWLLSGSSSANTVVLLGGGPGGPRKRSKGGTESYLERLLGRPLEDEPAPEEVEIIEQAAQVAAIAPQPPSRDEAAESLQAFGIAFKDAYVQIFQELERQKRQQREEDDEIAAIIAAAL